MLNSSPVCAAGNRNNEIIHEFLPAGSTLVSPEKPDSAKPYLFYDFDRDGREEIIFTYETKSNSQVGVIVLKKGNGGWRKIWETTTQGVGLQYSGLTDLTGDGTKEYLFGVMIGAAAGNNLEIFKWNKASFEKIADLPYHRFDLINGKRKGIAVWQRYIADTYFVDVLKWNGQKFVFDEKLFSKYYPVIEKFHKEKLSKMDAWFYWYTLADAQIKANLFDKATISIQKGMALVKQLQMPEEVEKFKELSDKLEKKKQSE
jgi:hypothetical protein